MDYLIAFIIAVGIACVPVIKGADRLTDDGDGHGDRKDGEK